LNRQDAKTAKKYEIDRAGTIDIGTGWVRKHPGRTSDAIATTKHKTCVIPRSIIASLAVLGGLGG
jgi:hypothetical protein